MPTQGRALIEVLSEIPDFRQPQGRRHPLAAILGLACAAMLCGYRSYSAMAEWGRNYGRALAQALGITQAKTPCAKTFHTIFRYVDREQVETKLGQWAAALLADAAEADLGVAIDGKTLCGSRQQGAPGAHLLSAVSQRLGLTLAQQAVDDRTNEITVIERLLKSLLLEGRIRTMDALLTQRSVAQTIGDGGGDYVMIVKKNQQQLYEDIDTLFQMPQAVPDTMRTAETYDSGHGRIEPRRLTARTALVGYSDWPGRQQVFRIERQITLKKKDQTRQEIVYGVTSLPPERAEPTDLLRRVRQHWHIENRSHWVRDVTFDEDRSQVRGGHIPQVMAA